MRFEFFKKGSENVFMQFWYNCFENKQIVVSNDVTCGIDLMFENFNEIESSVDKDLMLIHSFRVQKKVINLFINQD